MATASFKSKLKLPLLDPDKASFHPDCCLSLSRKVIKQILANIPSPKSLVLSVGSGTGLLEALISAAGPDVRLEVAEVRSVNRYMPDENVHTVNGTWDICARARDCDALLFVYPRDPSLISKYIDLISGDVADANVKTILWIGPAQDWPVFRPSFESSASFQLKHLVELSAVEKLASFEAVS